MSRGPAPGHVVRVARALRMQDGAQLVVPADSALYLDLEAAADVLAPEAAGQEQLFSTSSLVVQSLLLAAGPRDDDTTANAANLFIGAPGRAVFPLTPGAMLAIDAIDLQHLAWRALNAADRLRILYVA